MTGADPDGMAARHDFKEAYAVLEVAGKSAANPSDVRDCDQNALQA